MSIQTTYTLKQLESIAKRGGRVLLVETGDRIGHVLSWHKGDKAAYEAAQRSSYENTRRISVKEAIRELTPAPAPAPAEHVNEELIKTFEQSIENLKEERRRLEADINSSYLTDTMYVIQCGELYCSPSIVDGRTVAGAVRVSANPLNAVQFNKANAEHLGATITNGCGEKGRAVGRYHAVRERLPVCINDIEQLTKVLDAYKARTAATH